MTAEVAILNRGAIVLAADSAVTIGRERVWKTAHKLFSLGPQNDIGIMAHGAADYLGISWEIIVKMFRRHVGARRFRTVLECSDAFRDFLCSDKFRDDKAETISVAYIFVSALESIKHDILYTSKIDFRSKIIQQCEEKTSLIDEKFDRFNDSYSYKSFKKTWQPTIVALAKDIFRETITAPIKERLTQLMYPTVFSTCATEYSTGIVFAGYGEDELCPSVYHFTVDGRCDDIFRFWKERERNLNHGDASAAIIPFGQADIIATFMEGISSSYLSFIEQSIRGVLRGKNNDLINAYVSSRDEKVVERARQGRNDEIIIKEFLSEFRQYREETLSDPVLDVVDSLPKEEMAAMAEALIEITSLRRRVDSKMESVGGPVDVAIISKGDGFVWIKRKHYFKVDMNPSFLQRKYSREGT